MLFIGTVTAYFLRRKIRGLKADLDYLTSTPTTDNNYAINRQMIPLVEADLKSAKDKLAKLMEYQTTS